MTAEAVAINLRKLAEEKPEEVIHFEYSSSPTPPNIEPIAVGMVRMGLAGCDQEAKRLIDDDLKAFDQDYPITHYEHGRPINVNCFNTGSMGLLRAGSVIFYNLDPYTGNRNITEIADAPALLSEGNLFGKNNHLNFTEAFTDCELQIVRPGLSRFLFLVEAHRMQTRDEYQTVYAARYGETRLARVLLKLGEREFLPRITQQTLADFSQADRMTVNKSLARWNRSGIIVWEYKGPVLAHREKMVEISRL